MAYLARSSAAWRSQHLAAAARIARSPPVMAWRLALSRWQQSAAWRNEQLKITSPASLYSARYRYQ